LEQACGLFERSLQLDASPGTLLNLGNCYEQRADLVRALAAFEQARAGAHAERDPAKRQIWLDAAAERSAALAARVPLLSLRPAPVPGVSVRLNGQVIVEFASPLKLNPGRYRIEISAEHKRPHIGHFQLVEGQRLELAIPDLVSDPGSLPPTPTGSQSSLPGVVAPPPNTATPPATEATPGGGFNLLPWAFVGGGAALVLTGVVTGVLANGEAGTLDDQCARDSDLNDRRFCAPALQGNHDRGKNLALATDVLWALGVVSAGVGVTLLVTGSGDAEATSLRAACFGTGCSLSGRRRF
jgi:hypothetical protein